MCFLLNLNHCVKSYGHLCQILFFFTMPAHQVWSRDVTQDANFEFFLFCPNSAFNIRKSHKISSGKVLCFRSYQQKTSRGDGKHPPPPPKVPLGLKRSHYLCKGCVGIFQLLTDQMITVKNISLPMPTVYMKLFLKTRICIDLSEFSLSRPEP